MAKRKIDEQEWERVDHTTVPLTATSNKYKVTYEKGRIVYWKRKKRNV